MQLEVDILQQEVSFLEDSKAREDLIRTTLCQELRTQLDHVRHETLTDVKDLLGFIPEIQGMLGRLASTSSSMALTLKAVRERLEDKQTVATQTDLHLVGQTYGH
jgi:hypothetical protein